jgi:hypothetical protein
MYGNQHVRFLTAEGRTALLRSNLYRFVVIRRCLSDQFSDGCTVCIPCETNSFFDSVDSVHFACGG